MLGFAFSPHAPYVFPDAVLIPSSPSRSAPEASAAAPPGGLEGHFGRSDETQLIAIAFFAVFLANFFWVMPLKTKLKPFP